MIYGLFLHGGFIRRFYKLVIIAKLAKERNFSTQCNPFTTVKVIRLLSNILCVHIYILIYVYNLDVRKHTYIIIYLTYSLFYRFFLILSTYNIYVYIFMYMFYLYLKFFVPQGMICIWCNSYKRGARGNFLFINFSFCQSRVL